MEQSSKLRATVMAEVMAGAIAVVEVIITAGVEAAATITAGVGAVIMVGCNGRAVTALISLAL
jgi:hypothetical protein